MIVQIAHLKGKICVAIKIQDTRGVVNIALLSLKQLHGCRLYTVIEIHLQLEAFLHVIFLHWPVEPF